MVDVYEQFRVMASSSIVSVDIGGVIQVAEMVAVTE